MNQSELIYAFDRLRKGRETFAEVEAKKAQDVGVIKSHLDLSKADPDHPLGGEAVVRLEFYSTIIEATANLAKSAMDQAENQYRKAVACLIQDDILVALHTAAVKTGGKDLAGEFKEACALLELRVEEVEMLDKRMDLRHAALQKLLDEVR